MYVSYLSPVEDLSILYETKQSFEGHLCYVNLIQLVISEERTWVNISL